jgi:hypothetical protein
MPSQRQTTLRTRLSESVKTSELTTGRSPLTSESAGLIHRRRCASAECDTTPFTSGAHAMLGCKSTACTRPLERVDGLCAHDDRRAIDWRVCMCVRGCDTTPFTSMFGCTHQRGAVHGASGLRAHNERIESDRVMCMCVVCCERESGHRHTHAPACWSTKVR